ncbi:hypothetical protein UlMin_000384 [Ulmus minor]
MPMSPFPLPSLPLSPALALTPFASGSATPSSLLIHIYDSSFSPSSLSFLASTSLMSILSPPIPLLSPTSTYSPRTLFLRDQGSCQQAHEYKNGDDDYFDDEYDTAKAEVGDGAGGGGISLGGTWWDKKALEIALTKWSGSFDMEDIQAFSTTYQARLDEAELAKSIPKNVSLDVSSLGVERVVRVPNELDKFKDRNIYVRYIKSDGVFRLVSFDMETKCCTWGMADVRVNREKAGKGRPLSKKQQEWCLDTPFDSLCLL